MNITTDSKNTSFKLPNNFIQRQQVTSPRLQATEIIISNQYLKPLDLRNLLTINKTVRKEFMNKFFRVFFVFKNTLKNISMFEKLISCDEKLKFAVANEMKVGIKVEDFYGNHIDHTVSFLQIYRQILQTNLELFIMPTCLWMSTEYLSKLIDELHANFSHLICPKCPNLLELSKGDSQFEDKDLLFYFSGGELFSADLIRKNIIKNNKLNKTPLSERNVIMITFNSDSDYLNALTDIEEYNCKIKIKLSTVNRIDINPLITDLSNKNVFDNITIKNKFFENCIELDLTGGDYAYGYFKNKEIEELSNLVYEKCPNLNSLYLISQFNLKFIKLDLLKNLTSLHLNSIDSGVMDLEGFENNLTALTSFSISFLGCWSTNLRSRFPKLDRLEFLKIEKLSTGKYDLPLLPNLTSLSLHKYKSQMPSSFDFPFSIDFKIEGLPSLTLLETNCYDEIEFCTTLPKLQHIITGNSKNL